MTACNVTIFKLEFACEAIHLQAICQRSNLCSKSSHSHSSLHYFKIHRCLKEVHHIEMSSLLNISNSTPKNTLWYYTVHINIKWSCIVHIMLVNLTWEHKKKKTTNQNIHHHHSR